MRLGVSQLVAEQWKGLPAPRPSRPSPGGRDATEGPTEKHGESSSDVPLCHAAPPPRGETQRQPRAPASLALLPPLAMAMAAALDSPNIVRLAVATLPPALPEVMPSTARPGEGGGGEGDASFRQQSIQAPCQPPTPPWTTVQGRDQGMGCSPAQGCPGAL